MRQVIEVRKRWPLRCLPPIATACVFLLCAIAPTKGQGPEVKVIEMEIGDNMRYTPSVIDAEPGQKLRVVLKPVGKIKALGHNFVLLSRGPRRSLSWTRPRTQLSKRATFLQP